MSELRHVKLFRTGGGQAVQIPREFELPGRDALLRREGDRLILESSRAPSLAAILAELKPLDETFPDIDDPPPEPVRL